MKHSLVVWMPYAISIISIYVLIIAGKKHPFTWHFAVIEQLLWITWILISKNYGLLPITIFVLISCIRNIFLWREP